MAAGVPLKPVDAAWYHLDRAENTADVVALLTFARPLPFAKLRALTEACLLRHAPFRKRVVGHGLRDGASWVDDPAFSLDRHLVRHRLRSEQELQAFVSQVATTPIDLNHPPWRMYLVDGAGRGSVLVAKLHHCMADGFALIGLLLSLADEHVREAPRSGRVPSFSDWMDRSVSHVRAALGRASAFLRSLTRLSLLGSDARTSLKHPLSGRRQVAWSEGASLERVREAARRRGVTINDLLGAALAGGLRDTFGATGGPVRALVPVNLRPAGAPTGELGNRFGLVFLDMPIQLTTAEERLRALTAAMRRLKGTPDALVTFLLLNVMGVLPVVLQHLIAEFFSWKASLVVTNVPGPKRHLHIAGDRLEHVMFWVPHPARLGLGVSILSYAGEVRIGVRADEAVLPNPAELVERFETELETLLGPAPHPRVPPRRVPTHAHHSLSGNERRH